MKKTLLLATTICAFLFLPARLFAAEPQPVRSFPEAVRWLEVKAPELVRASVRKMNDGTAAFPPQAGPGYEAFWLRDYEYVLEGSADAISDKELRDACRVFLRALDKNGAGVDCVKFDGTAVYMPGYGTMGENPVADGSVFTIEMAWQTDRRLKDKEF